MVRGGGYPGEPHPLRSHIPVVPRRGEHGGESEATVPQAQPGERGPGIRAQVCAPEHQVTLLLKKYREQQKG
jgi:hypothetical protein